MKYKFMVFDDATLNRFWSKVDRRGPDECWEWRRHKQNGYGYFWNKRNGQARTRAHRISWILTYGSIPKGLCVCHKCDNRKCVNPEHLFLATRAVNIHDMDRKGRRHERRGEKSDTSKLKEWQVKDIMQAIRNGEKQVNLAEKYGVSVACISAINQGRLWSYLNEKGKKRTRLSAEQIADIKEAAAQGVSYIKIAATYNICHEHASRVARGIYPASQRKENGKV